jgi:hypothetical protein
MKTVKWWLDIGFANAARSGKVEVDDESTEAEIDDIIREEVHNYIEWGWSTDDTFSGKEKMK